jgi:hypothetical protein
MKWIFSRFTLNSTLKQVYLKGGEGFYVVKMTCTTLMFIALSHFSPFRFLLSVRCLCSFLVLISSPPPCSPQFSGVVRLYPTSPDTRLFTKHHMFIIFITVVPRHIVLYSTGQRPQGVTRYEYNIYVILEVN